MVNTVATLNLIFYLFDYYFVYLMIFLGKRWLPNVIREISFFFFSPWEKLTLEDLNYSRMVLQRPECVCFSNIIIFIMLPSFS